MKSEGRVRARARVKKVDEGMGDQGEGTATAAPHCPHQVVGGVGRHFRRPFGCER